MIVECPYCQRRVVLAPNGQCPSCLRELERAAEAAGPRDALVVAAEPTAESAQLRARSAGGMRQAWVTSTIIGLNVVVLLLMVVSGVSPVAPNAARVVAWGANYGPKTLDGQWWRLVTCMFLHFGVLHLAFNMWVLWDLGRLVERLFGHFWFALLYLFSGVCASAASLIWNPAIVSAGASGAVFGVCGALLGSVLISHKLNPLAVVSRMRNSLLAFLGYNLVFGLMVRGIDMAAHVGGLLAGLVGGAALSRLFTAPPGRWRRFGTVACTAGSILTLTVIVALLPDPPPDIAVELQQILKEIDQVLDTFQTAGESFDRQGMDAAQLTETVERSVLPPWQQLHQRLRLLQGLPQVKRDSLANIDRYMSSCEESWQILVTGLRNNDSAMLAKFRQKWQEANQIGANMADEP